MKTSSSTLAFPENVPGIRLLREEGAWKYLDLADGLDEAGLQMLLREMPADMELCFFEYQFGDRLDDESGQYVMLQMYEGECYFWKGSRGKSSPLERLGVAEASAMIRKNTVQEDAFLYLVPAARRFETRPDFRWHKAPERAPDPQGELLRHLLATLAFRFQRVVRQQSSDFGNFAAGQAARTPREIVRHMRSVLSFLVAEMAEEPRPAIEELPWVDEITAFHALLLRLDEILLADSFTEMSYKKILQGPLSDALTHVGQIALLRRLFGNPVAGISFFEAEIRTGNVGNEQ